jgi:hypothetical protein
VKNKFVTLLETASVPDFLGKAAANRKLAMIR